MIGDGESGAEIIPEFDPQLGASLGQYEEGIAAVAADTAAGATTDLAFGYLAAVAPAVDGTPICRCRHYHPHRRYRLSPPRY